ncbi:MAG: ThuA domain-containing protein [Fibrobacteria bacterium]
MKSFPIVARAVLAIGLCQAAVLAAPKKVLHLYAFGERPHVGAQQPMVNLLDELAAEHKFTVTHMKNQDAVMNIGDYDVVVFNSTAFGAFTKLAVQQKLQDWLTGGGKAIGIHGALDVRGYWDWWGNVVGSGSWYTDDFFAAFTLDTDSEIAKLPALKAVWDASGLGNQVQIPNTEIYVYNTSPRGKEGVTMLQTVNKAQTDIPDHPYSWHKKIGKGEFLYSAIGHSGPDFSTGWAKKAIWAWMQYLTSEVPMGIDGKHYMPFAQLEVDKNQVHIKDAGRHSVRVFDVRGSIRHHWTGTGEMVYGLQGLETGIYYLQVKSGHLDYTRPVTIQ